MTHPIALSNPLALLIQHTITLGCDDYPWPPLGQGWHLVGVLGDGRHLWRRIGIQEKTESEKVKGERL